MTIYFTTHGVYAIVNGQHIEATWDDDRHAWVLPTVTL